MKTKIDQDMTVVSTVWTSVDWAQGCPIFSLVRPTKVHSVKIYIETSIKFVTKIGHDIIFSENKYCYT